MDTWDDFLWMVPELIASINDPAEVQCLAKRLREIADAADARAVELTLDPSNFVMKNASERVQ